MKKCNLLFLAMIYTLSMTSTIVPNEVEGMRRQSSEQNLSNDVSTKLMASMCSGTSFEHDLAQIPEMVETKDVRIMGGNLKNSFLPLLTYKENPWKDLPLYATFDTLIRNDLRERLFTREKLPRVIIERIANALACGLSSQFGERLAHKALNEILASNYSDQEKKEQMLQKLRELSPELKDIVISELDLVKQQLVRMGEYLWIIIYPCKPIPRHFLYNNPDAGAYAVTAYDQYIQQYGVDQSGHPDLSREDIKTIIDEGDDAELSGREFDANTLNQAYQGTIPFVQNASADQIVNMAIPLFSKKYKLNDSDE